MKKWMGAIVRDNMGIEGTVIKVNEKRRMVKIRLRESISALGEEVWMLMDELTILWEADEWEVECRGMYDLAEEDQ